MDYKIIYNEFNDIQDVWNIIINDVSYVQLIELASDCIVGSFKNGGKVLTCGNGGSHCNSMHFAEELTGRYRDNRVGYPAIAISDPCHISCVGNDFGYEYIFSRYIESIGNFNDVLLAITTSGKSINILRAINIAFMKNMKVIVFSGNYSVSEIISRVPDIEICVPYSKYADRIQEVHMKLLHILILLIENKMRVS